MKNIVKILWAIVALLILAFIVVVLIVESDYIKWRIFAVIMPFTGICMCCAIMVSLIRLFSSNDK